jgi:putative transcriptional regulator
MMGKSALLTAFVVAVSLIFVGAQAHVTKVRKTEFAPIEHDGFGPQQPAAGKFLVAGGSISDPRFQEAVVLLIDYSEKGATGLIVNRPTNAPLSDVLPDIPALGKRSDVVYYGGPVEGGRMLMLFRSAKRLKEAKRIFGDVHISASRRILEQALDERKSPKEWHLYAGYAGWSPGQLDRELLQGSWRVIDADAASIFEKEPSRLWRELSLRASAVRI